MKTEKKIKIKQKGKTKKHDSLLYIKREGEWNKMAT